MKENVKAPSLQGKEHFTIIPDILAEDELGRGWCFEVKSERESRTRMRHLELPGGYTGPAWFLERYKAGSYLRFSRAFNCPCVIAIEGDFQWRAGFFTRLHPVTGDVVYNTDLVVAGWKDSHVLPVLFSVLNPIEKLLTDLQDTRKTLWQD